MEKRWSLAEKWDVTPRQIEMDRTFIIGRWRDEAKREGTPHERADILLRIRSAAAEVREKGDYKALKSLLLLEAQVLGLGAFAPKADKTVIELHPAQPQIAPTREALIEDLKALPLDLLKQAYIEAGGPTLLLTGPESTEQANP